MRGLVMPKVGCHLTTHPIILILETTDGSPLSSQERGRGSSQARRRAGLARRSRRQPCLGPDLLAVQRRGMPLRRVLHHQRMDTPKNPGNYARALRRVVDNCTTRRRQRVADDGAQE